jgi:putative membrane protein
LRVERSLHAEIAFPRASRSAREDLIGLITIFVIGGVPSWLCERHPTLLPGLAPWEFSWMEFLAASLGLWWYARGAAQTKPLAWREGVFALGVVAICAALQSHFELHGATQVLSEPRAAHHWTVPGSAVLAGESLRRGMPAPVPRLTELWSLRRAIGFVQQPALAGLLLVGLIYLFLIPAGHFPGHDRFPPLRDHELEHGDRQNPILVPGLGPAAAATGASQLRDADRPPVAVMLPQIALGSHIALRPGGLYPCYDLCGRLFPSISAAYYQHVGGIIVWIPAAMMSVVGFMTVLNALRVHEDALAPEAAEDGDDATCIVLDASAWTGR